MKSLTKGRQITHMTLLCGAAPGTTDEATR
jgi:hypothetical protein